MSAYDDAVHTLYQAAFSDFVAERKRLATELKSQGDKTGAAQLAKLQRPPVSAWAVNQLWWRERAAFQDFIALAARVTASDRDAARQHREALAALREHASRILQENGNAATESTLRRVTTTLAAIAAAGSFAPDASGALSADRDPPGFEALGFAAAAPSVAAPSVAAPSVAEAAPKAKPSDATEQAEKRRIEAEKRHADEEERKRRLVERERLSAALREAQRLQTTQQHELSRLRDEVAAAEQGLKETQALLTQLQEQLANL